MLQLGTGPFHSVIREGHATAIGINVNLHRQFATITWFLSSNFGVHLMIQNRFATASIANHSLPLSQACNCSIHTRPTPTFRYLSVMPETMEISDAAKSGDGTTQNVGIKVSASFQCGECRQKFDSDKAKQLHWKFIHDPNRHQEDWALARQGFFLRPFRSLQAKSIDICPPFKGHEVCRRCFWVLLAPALRQAVTTDEWACIAGSG